MSLLKGTTIVLKIFWPRGGSHQIIVIAHYIEDLVIEVQRALCTSFSEFDGSIEDENDMELLIEKQFEVLKKALKIPHTTSEARMMVSKKFLALFRAGKLGPFILDDVPDSCKSTS
ncbi:Short integuments 2, mitochondrial [Ancistrocladus abbreviatus]